MYSRGSADRRSAFTSPVIAIQSDTEALYAHKALLDDSPVIRDELKSNHIGFIKTLHCYDTHKTVNMFLEFLYTGRYTLPPTRSTCHTVPPVPARHQTHVSEVSHPVTVPLRPFSTFRAKSIEDLRAPIESVRCDGPAILAHARVGILAQKTGVMTLCAHTRDNLAESLSILDASGCESIAGELGDLLGLIYDENLNVWAGAKVEYEKMKETIVIFTAWNLEPIMRARSERFTCRLEQGGKLVSDLMSVATRRLVFPLSKAAVEENYVAPPQPTAAPEPVQEQVQEQELAKVQVPEPVKEEEPELKTQVIPAAEEPKVPKVTPVEVDVTQFLEPESDHEQLPEPATEEIVKTQPDDSEPTPAPSVQEERDNDTTPVQANFPAGLPTPDPEEHHELPMKKESETPTLADEYPTPPTVPVFARDGWIEDPKHEPISLDSNKSDGVPISWKEEADRIVESEKRTNGFVDSGFTTTPQPTIPSSTPPPLTPPTGPRSMTPGTPPLTSINGMPIPTGPKNANKKKKKAKKGANTGSPNMMHAPMQQMNGHQGGYSNGGRVAW